MSEAEFDQFSKNYETVIDTHALTSIGGTTSREFIKLKCNELLVQLKREGIDTSTAIALDAGCGNGIAEEFLAPHFKKMIGVDLSAGMIREAELKGLSRCEFLVSDASSIPLPPESVHVLFSFCIFHHADQNQLSALLSEAKRLLAPDGFFAVFEHNPWNPLTRYVVSQCPVDADVVLLSARYLSELVRKASFRRVKTRFLLFVPRFLKPFLFVEKHLHWLPLGGQYMISARKSPK